MYYVIVRDMSFSDNEPHIEKFENIVAAVDEYQDACKASLLDSIQEHKCIKVSLLDSDFDCMMCSKFVFTFCE